MGFELFGFIPHVILYIHSSATDAPAVSTLDVAGPEHVFFGPRVGFNADISDAPVLRFVQGAEGVAAMEVVSPGQVFVVVLQDDLRVDV